MGRARYLPHVVWLAWAGWVAAHYFTIPGDPFAAFSGPYPLAATSDALVRSARAIVGAGIVVLAAWGVGSAVWRRAFGDVADEISDQIAFALALGFGILAYSFLALAFAHLYRPGIVAVALGVAALFGLRRVASGWSTIRAIRTLSPSDPIVFACAAVAVAIALVGALAPESEYDALWYHLWLPEKWLEAAHPVDIVEEYVSLYPLTWELLYGGASVVGGPIAAKLVHWLCLPLVGAASFQLTRRVAPDASPMLAAALTVTAPIVLWEATTAYVDLALAWYVALAALALFRHDQTRDRRWLVLAAVMLGIALGIKHLALVVLAVGACALVVREWRLTRRLAAACRAAALFTAISLLIPSPWYARAYASSGNPVFPELYSVFGARPAERWDDAEERALSAFKAHFGRARSPAALAALPWDMTIHGAQYGGTLGPLFLILIPALVLSTRRRAGSGSIAVIAAGCVAYVAVWASPLSSFQMRFLIPIVPLLATLGADGAARLSDRRASRARPLVIGAIVVLLIMDMPPAIEWHERDRHEWQGWLTHVVRGVPAAVVIGAEPEGDYLARLVPSYPAWQFIDATLPAAARVLTFSGGDQLYSARPRIWSDAAAARPLMAAAAARSGGVLLRAAAVQHVTHLLVDKRLVEANDPRASAIVSSGMQACCLMPLYEDSRFVLYELGDRSEGTGLARNR